MLNSHKLLYILPDVAYITELLPTKKEHTFTIQSFRQINGEFIDDNDFIAENIKKLIGKLDAEEYHLILPDFLFTNTIVEVAETDESKVIAHLKSKLLPELTLSPETHQLKTFVLTNHAGKSKVQLSALEKSLMNPISQNAEEKGIKIKAISPLSWTIKSIISLEPSISIFQMGSHAYLAQHYIGIDQAMEATVDDIANLSETIKTLKGGEPSIQTVYLITNQLVEEKLKENLSGTLPLQQLASFSEEDGEMPSYVKFGIEAGMKTLSLDAFPVPKFPLPEPTEEAPAIAASTDTKEKESTKEMTETKEETAPIEDTTNQEQKPEATDTTPDSEETSDLPKPDVAPSGLETTAATAATTTVASTVSEITLDSEDKPDLEKSEEATTESVSEVEDTDQVSQPPTKDEPTEEKTPEEEKPEVAVSAPQVSMKKEEEEKEEKPEKEAESETTSKKDNDDKPEKKTDVIKNQSGLQPMLKMLGISFVVFLITIAVGIGVGRAFIYFTQQNSSSDQQTPVTTATPLPSEEPSPSPSPEPEIDVSELSILVVNATTKAGYAGDTKDALDEAKFGEVDASNAKGDYEENGTIVLMEEENTAIIDALEEAIGESLTFEEGAEIEDTQGNYDAIIVLTE